MKVRHPSGTVVDVPKAKAQRLVASGYGWQLLDKTDAESVSEPVNEVPEGDDTPEPVPAPQEPSQPQEPASSDDPVPPSDADLSKDPAPTMEDIRAWARANRPELGVKEAGRVSKAATQAYREAHNL